MKSIEEIRQENFVWLVRPKKGIKQAELARLMQVSPAQIHQWKTGFRTPETESCRKIEEAAKLPPGWMDQDHSAIDANFSVLSEKAIVEIEKKLQGMPGLAAQIAAHSRDIEQSRDSFLKDDVANFLVALSKPLPFRNIPIVGMAQLGDNGFYEELGFPPGDGDGFIQSATKDVNAYALKVRGNSMHPAIRDGWIVMVEPNSEPQVGEFAVVQCANGRKMVKEFLGWRGDELILQSVNEDHGRLTLHRSEVKAIHHVGGIHPPSKREMR